MKNAKLAVMITAVLTAASISACAIPQVSIPAAPAAETETAAETAEPDVVEDTDVTIPEIEAGIEEVKKAGNIQLTVSPDTMREMGYEPADIILVRIGDSEMEMPIGTAYSDVDNGKPLCCFKVSSADGLEHATLSINYGNLLEAMGLGTINKIDADPGFEVVWADGIDESVPVYISMVEKQGYTEYELHKLTAVRTNERADYAKLTDEEYANFREVDTSGIKPGILFRSSSPIDPSLNRNAEADAALLAAGVKTIVNMTDNAEGMKAYSDYELTAYSDCNIIALNMGMDFFAEDFKERLAEGFRFMVANPGPYLIHCKEGKDRTGFAAAILECLMGANTTEVVRDFMLTFYNFYDLSPDSEQYMQIADSNIKKTLAEAFGIASLDDEGIDLSACAENYLKEIGMTDEEIQALKDCLQ